MHKKTRFTKEERWLITFFITLIHCVSGNIIGVSNAPEFIKSLFFPYSLISGMSSFAGWDGLSLMLEVISLGIMSLIFYALIYFIGQLRNQQHHQDNT